MRGGPRLGSWLCCFCCVPTVRGRRGKPSPALCGVTPHCWHRTPTSCPYLNTSAPPRPPPSLSTSSTCKFLSDFPALVRGPSHLPSPCLFCPSRVARVCCCWCVLLLLPPPQGVTNRCGGGYARRGGPHQVLGADPLATQDRPDGENQTRQTGRRTDRHGGKRRGNEEAKEETDKTLYAVAAHTPTALGACVRRQSHLACVMTSKTTQ